MNFIILSRIAQVILCLLLILFTLIQSKGIGLASSFSSSFNLYRSRRGLEKGIFVATIVVTILLVVNSLLLTILK